MKNLLDSKYAMPLILMILALILYGNTFKNGFVLDDHMVYVNNEYVQEGLGGIGDIFSHGYVHGFNKQEGETYRPLVLTSFAIDKAVFKGKPFGSHFINALLYGLVVILVYRLLTRMLQGYNRIFALLGALLFLVHPIHTEAVANIKSRDEILQLLFLAWTVLLLFQSIDHKDQKKWYWSIGTFTLAMLSKEMSAVFVFIIPLFLYFFTRESWKKIAVFSFPYAGILALFLVLRAMLLQDNVEEQELHVLNNSLVAAEGLGEKMATVILISGTYLKLLFVPYPMSFDYSFNQIPITNFSDISVLLWLVVGLALIAYAIMRFTKKDPIAFAILFLFMTMAVVSNIFFSIGAVLGERFLFTPSLAFALAVPLALAKLLKIDPTAKKLKNGAVLVGGLAVVMVTYAVLTIDRNKDWESNFTLFSADIKAAPNSTRVQNSLATSFREKAEQSPNPNVRMGHYQKAISLYQKSIEILPSNFDSWYNIGICYAAIGKEQEALNCYNKTIEYAPEHMSARNNIGVYYFNRKEYDKARFVFNKMLELNPNFSKAHANLGAISYNTGDYQKAIQSLEFAYELNPHDIQNLDNLVRVCEKLGDGQKASFYQQQAIEERKKWGYQ